MDDLRARGKPKVGAARDFGGSASGSGTAIGHHDGPGHGDRETHWRRQQYCEESFSPDAEYGLHGQQIRNEFCKLCGQLHCVAQDDQDQNYRQEKQQPTRDRRFKKFSQPSKASSSR